MANKVETFLSAIGKAFKTPLAIATTTAQVAAPFISIANPGLGSAFTLASNVAMLVEQKYAAIGQQSGTGPQKLAEATAVSGAGILAIMQANGAKDATLQDATNYISAAVNLLNSWPASAAAPATAPAAATS